jgi:hypothetical protein
LTVSTFSNSRRSAAAFVWVASVGFAVIVNVWLPAGIALAKAAPLATTILDVEARAAPSWDAVVVMLLPAGTETELTGAVAPGFLAVYNDGEPVWVPAQYLALGVRPGVDTATAVQATPLLNAPMHDAEVLAMVPEGEAVILTGARLDGYDAASRDGVGGWIRERDLAR